MYGLVPYDEIFCDNFSFYPYFMPTAQSSYTDLLPNKSGIKNVPTHSFRVEVLRPVINIVRQRNDNARYILLISCSFLISGFQNMFEKT